MNWPLWTPDLNRSILKWVSNTFLMEGLELVGRDRSLVLVKVSQRVLGAVVVSIIVGVDGLRLETGNGIELLDGRGAKTGQGTEHSALDFRNFRILDGVDKGVLSLGSVLLQFMS